MPHNRPPRGYRHQRHVPANQASCAGLLQAMQALYSDEPGLEGEAALAEKERLRVEGEACKRRQGELLLRGAR